MAADLVNLTAERTERRPVEMDHRCRDCDRVFAGLVQLADHYAFVCNKQ